MRSFINHRFFRMKFMRDQTTNNKTIRFSAQFPMLSKCLLRRLMDRCLVSAYDHFHLQIYLYKMLYHPYRNSQVKIWLKSKISTKIKKNRLTWHVELVRHFCHIVMKIFEHYVLHIFEVFVTCSGRRSFRSRHGEVPPKRWQFSPTYVMIQRHRQFC